MKNLGKQKVLLFLLITLIIITGCNNNKETVKEEVTETTETEENTKEEETEKINETEEETSKNSESLFEKTKAEMDKSLEPLPKKNGGYKLGYLINSLSNEFWVTTKNGGEEAASEFGSDISVQATESTTDTVGQLDLMNGFIAQEVDGIAAYPFTEDNLISGIVEANNKDIKIVTTGNIPNAEALESQGGHVDYQTMMDFYTQGVLGAEYVVEQNNNEGKVAIIAGIEGATNSDDRRDGAKSVFENSNMEIVAIEHCDWDSQRAYDAASAIIQANPDIKGFACANDDMALGVVSALEEKDMKDQVTVVGIDLTSEAKQAIEDGRYDASVAMSPYLGGRKTVIILLKLIEGHDVQQIEDVTPMELITKDNVHLMNDWK